MSSSEKREIAVPKYFIATPEEPIQDDTSFMVIFTVGGAVAAVIGLANFRDAWWLLCLGAPLAIFAAFLLSATGSGNSLRRSEYDDKYKKAEPKPSDEQMDSWQKSDLDRIRKASLSKLDLESLTSQIMGNPKEPIMVVGPSAGAHAALGKDNIIRFSIYDVVIVYLTDYHLAAYKCTFDMVHGLETKESTKEYHYKNVVAVSTESDNSRTFKIVVDGEDKPLANYQKFSLSVASGEKIEVVIAFPQLDDIMKNAHPAPTGAENAIKQIRARLREKTGGIQE